MHKADKILLVIGLCLLAISIYDKYSIASKQPKNIPTPKVVVPNVKPETPKPKVNIFENECDKALKVAEEYKRPLVIIFGAKWCPYCKELKKDLEKITELNNYVVCLIDIGINKTLVKHYKIKSLPTSVIVVSNKEQDRKVGYELEDYSEWLKNNNHGEKTWSNLSISY
jgi:thioredoxin-related protein